MADKPPPIEALKGASTLLLWLASVLAISLICALLSLFAGGLLVFAWMHIEYVFVVMVIALFAVIAIANR